MLSKLVKLVLAMVVLTVIFLASKTAFAVIMALILSLVALALWVKGGAQSAASSIPTKFDDTPFRTYEAVVPGSPLKLLHFISEANEINVSSSLVMGDHELICFTAQPTKYSAERLADVIEETGRKLTYIYLDHAHLDHSQGATELLKRFPDAKCVAAPRVAQLQQLRIEADDNMARKRYGDNAAVPSVKFEAWDTDKIMLEGREIHLWHDQYGDVGVGHEDEPHTVAYIPDLKALLPTDICYFGGHVMMGGSTPTSRAKVKEQLREWMKMDLEVVIPGHILRSWSADLTPQATMEYSLKYIEDYEAALETCKTADEVIAKMLAIYPKQEHVSALYLGTYVHFEEMHRLLFNPRIEKIFALMPKGLSKWINKSMFAARVKAANP
ncbi:hypothetical protein [Cognatishimia activa]|uniref:hypothetical protein n=1 Tax=Cognatishimia activa TaxID=1715691 RepID=UPI00222EA6B3|nr:hypothetical protein [Cognatishimia activa]UZD91473.1 hypothetical protein M0D42_02305 [Cognatishimia activa]